jgi:Icc-related predicted phosphoesterase
MKIWIISDSHTLHRDLSIPEVDMVIHCGDATNSRGLAQNLVEFEDFNDWFQNLPIEHKIFVPGNHCLSLQAYPSIAKGCSYPILIHETIEIGGLKIFGSPYTPAFGNWAFNVKRGRLHDYWAAIPEDCDIICTHGPSRGTLDLTDDFDTGKPIQVGCESLRKRLDDLSPKLHCHGHLHSNPSKKYYNTGAIFNRYWRVNASCVNDGDMRLSSNGFIFDTVENTIKPVLQEKND